MLRAGQGRRLRGHQLRHHGRRGALARSARRRCRHRAGLRGRRPSRHVPDRRFATQVGTFALVPQIVDAVKVPVIAAGGIADARGIAAALALGAAGVQIGTAYLWCPEAKISAPHRAALKTRGRSWHRSDQPDDRPPGARRHQPGDARDRSDLGRGASFPLAAGALAPLRAKAEARAPAIFRRCGRGRRPRSGARCRPVN